MSLDVCFFAWNRKAFTCHSLNLLLANTNWEHVDQLILIDDGSTDGSTDILKDARKNAPVPVRIIQLAGRGPVSGMNFYLDNHPASLFAKIDNDIAVPAGWLPAMLDVLDRNPPLELLGMELGRGILRSPPPAGVHGFEPCSHIGGVGVMRSAAFLSRPRMRPRGRFGFTNWQHEQEPVRGWIAPWLPVLQLDRLPFEPWRSLSAGYVAAGWQREWPVWGDEQADAWAWMTRCEHCRDSGHVCEDHPDLPWAGLVGAAENASFVHPACGDGARGCHGAGMPCPHCCSPIPEDGRHSIVEAFVPDWMRP